MVYLSSAVFREMGITLEEMQSVRTGCLKNYWSFFNVSIFLAKTFFYNFFCFFVSKDSILTKKFWHKKRKNYSILATNYDKFTLLCQVLFRRLAPNLCPPRFFGLLKRLCHLKLRDSFIKLYIWTKVLILC